MKGGWAVGIDELVEYRLVLFIVEVGYTSRSCVVLGGEKCL